MLSLITEKNMEKYKSLLALTNNTRIVGTRIWRSDAVCGLTEADIGLLVKKGITAFIDMRTDDEVGRSPSAFADIQGFEYHHIAVTVGSVPPPSLEEVPLSYMEIAREPVTAEVFRVIASARDGAMFGCTAGKDRTGVIAAILQLLCGADDQTIIKDYALSREYNRKRLEQYISAHPEVDRNVVLANEKSMERFLCLFREKYGSAKNYFDSIGVPTGRLFEKMTE